MSKNTTSWPELIGTQTCRSFNACRRCSRRCSASSLYLLLRTSSSLKNHSAEKLIPKSAFLFHNKLKQNVSHVVLFLGSLCANCFLCFSSTGIFLVTKTIQLQWVTFMLPCNPRMQTSCNAIYCKGLICGESFYRNWTVKNSHSM